MKVYDIFDSGWLGVYQERAVVVFISDVRTVIESQWICEMVTERYQEPDQYKTHEKWIPKHTKIIEVWIPETTEVRSRVVPGYYKDETALTPAHWGTRLVWLEPHIEIQYKFVGTSEQRAGRAGWEEVDGEYVFVGTSAQRAGRAGWKSYEVEIPGEWVDRRIWFPDVRRTTKVWVPESSETYEVVVPGYMKEVSIVEPGRRVEYPVYYEGKWVTKEHLVCGWKNVEVQQPVYSYYYPEYEYEVLDIKKGPVMVIAGPPEGDKITLRTPVSKLEVNVEGHYLGVATKIDDNRYVLPVEKPMSPVELEELSEEEIEKIKWGD